MNWHVVTGILGRAAIFGSMITIIAAVDDGRRKRAQWIKSTVALLIIGALLIGHMAS